MFMYIYLEPSCIIKYERLVRLP